MLSRDAVHKILKRISAQALTLRSRRSEINRRIRDLHQLLHSLGDHSTKPERFMSPGSGTGRRSREQPSNSRLRDKGSLPGCMTLHRPSRPSRPSKHVLARLRRACRIALLEAGGVASLDEIRVLIARRGSFAFDEPGSSGSALLQTLHSMRVSGEVHCLENHPPSVWERITLAEEVDLAS